MDIMKNLFLVLLLVSTFVFTSCEKQVIEPQIEEVVTIDEEISLFGTWRLVGGKMYVENLETHEKVVYNHFDSIRTTSSLRYGGPMFDFEVIKIDSTIWTFKSPNSIPGYGEFWLNLDSIQPYGLYITNTNWTIVEHPTATSPDDMHLGGSARPFHAWIENYDQKTVNFYVQEAYEAINGYNHKYFSELTFKKID